MEHLRGMLAAVLAALIWTGTGAAADALPAEDQAFVDGYQSLKASSHALQSSVDGLKKYVLDLEIGDATNWSLWQKNRAGLYRVEFEMSHMRDFLSEVSNSTAAPPIEAISRDMSRVFGAYSDALHQLEQAIETHDESLLRFAKNRIAGETATLRHILTHIPALKARAVALTGQAGLEQEVQFGCPYAAGSKLYSLNCIGENDLAKSNGPSDLGVEE